MFVNICAGIIFIIYFFSTKKRNIREANGETRKTLTVNPEHCQNILGYLNKNVMIKLTDNN